MAIGVRPPLINGTAYTHADVTPNIMGVPIVAVTAIKYADKQTITLNHSTGHLPTSRGFGTVMPEATITMTMEEAERLSAAAPDGRIQNFPDFPIGINFATEDGKFTRHRLVRCRFTGRSVDSEVNNSQLLEELELSVADIRYQ